MKTIPLTLLLTVLLLFDVPVKAQTNDAYTTPKAFMDLFFDFTGSNESDYPGNQPTLGQMLAETAIARDTADGKPRTLIVIMGSDIYLYESAERSLTGHIRFRADRSTGFYEVTAISHIGPALAYLAEIKADGNPQWRARMDSLLANVQAVRALNSQSDNNWLDALDQKAWAAHKVSIRNMIDYACALTENYILSIGTGENFNSSSVNIDFFQGVSDEFPIPFNNAMVGTFMLAALRGGYEAYMEFGGANVTWPTAMAIVSSQAGANVSSGLTAGTNWLVFFLQALSGFTLPADRIIIAPYAAVKASLGQPVLPVEDFDYYTNQVWGPLYYRGVIADQAFQQIPTIYLPSRPPLPGDHGFTRADNIDHFMIRLKHSLRDEREMLSNTVGFWMVQELYDKGWDPAAVDIPGITTGFPLGIDSYPPIKAAVSTLQ